MRIAVTALCLLLGVLMPAKKDRRQTVPVPLGGMYSAADADPALLAEGYVRTQRNTWPRPGGGWAARPAFVHDLTQTSGTYGFIEWEDRTNNVRRLIAIGREPSRQAHIKAASGETWTALGESAPVGAPRSWTNFRDRAYWTVSAGVNVYDSNNVFSSHFNTENYNPLVVTTYINRLFSAGGTVTISNELPNVLDAYDPTRWTLTNVSAINITTGSTITGTIRPTNATTATATLPAITVTGSASVEGADGTFIYLAQIGADSASYNMPVTLRLLVTKQWAAATVYAANDIVVPTTSNNFRYRVSAITTGISGGVEPVWPTTPSSTIVDNGVTWICDGPEVIGSREDTIPNITEESGFRGYPVRGLLRVPYGATKISAQIKFGTTSTTSVDTNVAIRIGFRDGLADGNSAKANHGQQVTQSSAHHPFFNQESSLLNTAHDYGDVIYWSEPGEPSNVLAQNTFLLRDRAGEITAMTVVGGRLVVFKRDGVDTFVPNEADPDNPIIREQPRVGVGALGPRAIAVFEDTIYGIGENFVWSWRPGEEFRDLTGDAMRDEVMDKSSATWVESQVSYNTPLVTIDQARGVLYVYTQKGKIYGYDIRRSSSRGPVWFRWDVNSSGFEVSDMIWHQTTGNLYVAWGGHGVSRLDLSVTNQADAVNNSGTTYTVVSQTDIPIEYRGPQYDVILDRVNAYIKATADQTGQVFYVYVSDDQGATFTRYNEITLPVNTSFQSIPIALYQMQPSFVIRLEKQGNGGAANYLLSSAEAEINVMRGAFPRVTPTGVASSLTG